MKTGPAILLVLVIFLVCIFLPPIVMTLVVLGTSLWAAVDSSKIDLYRYKSGISTKPIGIFLGCLLLWIIAFPWYLSMRYKITNGLAELKDQYREADSLDVKADTGGAEHPQKDEKQAIRPKLVWATTIFYVISVPFTLLSFYSVLTGQVPLSPAMQAYFDSLSAFDYSLTGSLFSDD